jgi:hypothetical protein
MSVKTAQPLQLEIVLATVVGAAETAIKLPVSVHS